ncbi:MAG: hypothetical protein DMD96_35140 [Candidatus Rokuibacteriota bacterium]|nr:MAG: hypothetical protein DMD96_35140 [Candidatus Rokubacteria bacterium]
MGRLTSAERRRIFLTQERTRQTMLARMSVAPTADIDHGGPSRHRLRRLLRTVLILALFTGGLAFYEFVEFHPPASLMEAFLQRR